MVPRDPLDPVRGMSDSAKRDPRADGQEALMKRNRMAHSIGEIVVVAFIVAVVLAKVLVTIFR